MSRPDVPAAPGLDQAVPVYMPGLLARWQPGFIVFMSSACLMAVEMVAGRLVSRHVGSSIYTWTSVIGVIFAGMSLGNYIGGRLAARWRPRVLLGELFLLAAFLVAAELWLVNVLGIVHRDRAWPQPGHSFRGGLALTGNSLLGLAEPPLPAEIADKLRPLTGTPARDREEFGRMLAGVLTGPEVETHLDRIWESCEQPPIGRELRKKSLKALRDAGVSETVLTELDKLRDRPFADRAAMEKELAGTLSEADVKAHGERIWNAAVPGRRDVFPALTAESLAALGRPALPAETAEKLRPLLGRTFADRASLGQRLAGVLSAAEAEAYSGRILDAAEPMGPAFQQMREDGVPDDVIGQLTRPFPDPQNDPDTQESSLEPMSLMGFSDNDADKLRLRVRACLDESQPLRRRYSSDRRQSFASAAVSAAREEPVFTFPVRLLAAVVFIFAAPAVALGLISPVVAQMALDVSRSSGRAVGSVYAWGAWGSIIGTFLTGFVLISWIGCQSTLALTAITLAALALLTAPPRLLQGVWLVLLVAVTLPVFHQHRGPDAVDQDPAAVNTRLAAGGMLQRLWHSLPREIGERIHILDSDLGENTLESDYQFIKITSDARTSGGPEDKRTMSLDHLIHGYVAFRMPGDDPRKWDDPNHVRPDFDFASSVFDHAYLEYAYERVYAVSTARVLGGRFRDVKDADGKPAVKPPVVQSLFLGGGTYTFQRYLCENYPGEERTARNGDTVAALVEEVYAPKNDSDRRELVDRVFAYNRQRAGRLARAEAPALSDSDRRRLTFREVARPDDRLDEGTPVLLPSIADVAELDPMVTEVNHTRLKLPRPDQDSRIKTWNYDARNFVEGAVAAGWKGKYDVIYGDAFNHYSVPYHLTTKEFNDKVRELLTPDGAYIALIIDKYETCRFLSAETATFRKTFPHVYVFAARSKSNRQRRETFVLVGANKPQTFEFLGGAADDVTDLVAKGDLEGLARELSDDAGAMEMLREQLAVRKLPPAEVVAELDRMKRIDRHALVDAPDKVLAEMGQSTVSLTPAEIDDEIINLGRPLTMWASIRSSLPGRLMFGRVPASYRLTEESFRRLKDEDKVPAAVLDKLESLRDKDFSDVEAFADALAGSGLTRTELRAHKAAVVRRGRDRDAGKAAALVLTDSSAPVEDLLSPLFEED